MGDGQVLARLFARQVLAILAQEDTVVHHKAGPLELGPLGRRGFPAAIPNNRETGQPQSPRPFSPLLRAWSPSHPNRFLIEPLLYLPSLASPEKEPVKKEPIHEDRRQHSPTEHRKVKRVEGLSQKGYSEGLQYLCEGRDTENKQGSHAPISQGANTPSIEAEKEVHAKGNNDV
jgi:hypothetical protein